MAWMALNAVAAGLRSPRSLLSNLGLLGHLCQTSAAQASLASTSGSSSSYPGHRHCSSAVSVPRTAAEGVVPQELLLELSALEQRVYQGAKLDGRSRGSFSISTLSAQLPQHTIEPGLPVITAHARVGTGGNMCKWLRKTGRMPARVFSLPGQINIHLKQADGAKLVRQFGRNGCQARVVQLNIVHPDDEDNVLAKLRVKPHGVMIRSNTAMLEALTFMYCPADRIVSVDVPIKLVNDDAAPGIKKGGWMAVEKRVVRYRCLGSSIPPFIEVDVRHLELDTAVRLRDLPIPPGTKLVAKNYDVIVVRCTTDVGKDI